MRDGPAVDEQGGASLHVHVSSDRHFRAGPSPSRGVTGAATSAPQAAAPTAATRDGGPDRSGQAPQKQAGSSAGGGKTWRRDDKVHHSFLRQ